MKTREELIEKAGQFYANPDIKYPTDVLQLFTLMADFALSLEGTCKWRTSVLGQYETDCENTPYMIKTGDYKYCPYCGKKIERIEP